MHLRCQIDVHERTYIQTFCSLYNCCNGQCVDMCVVLSKLAVHTRTYIYENAFNCEGKLAVDAFNCYVSFQIWHMHTYQYLHHALFAWYLRS